MGEVWIAEQVVVGTRVAIKFLAPDISSQQAQVQRFFNEAVATSKIRHAGIIKIFDVGFHDGRAFLIMELLEGETLGARLRATKGLSVDTTTALLRQIAGILEATHAAGITHRDLKPDNIFLVPDAELASGARVKIIDFGIAKLGLGLTATGGAMGTPAYMAPEQWTNAARAEPRSDVYALGCVAYEMLCGRPPFEISSIPEAYAKHREEQPSPLRTVVPLVPASLDDLVGRMLAKRCEDRPTMREVGAALTPQAAPPREPRRAMVPVLVIGAAGALAGSAFAVRTCHREASSSGDAAQVVEAPPRQLQPPMPVDAAPQPRCDAPRRPINPWIVITPPAQQVALGLDDEAAPAKRAGFRPSRRIGSPSGCYAIQQHEVTWAELDPYLAASQVSLPSPSWANDARTRPHLPASGVPWSVADAYCRSIGGELPSEEQWEFAARGVARRRNPWGDEALDPTVTRVRGAPANVMSHPQDETPEHVRDLAGNVQEWTASRYRDDKDPNLDDEVLHRDGAILVYAIRGLALDAATSFEDASSYRDGLCVVGPCVSEAQAQRERVGFRCVLPVMARVE